MPRDTTFNVIYLGNLSDLDTVEGDLRVENIDSLVGQTFGDTGDPLLNHAATWSLAGDTSTNYETSNSPPSQFSIDGGPPQTFDSAARYDGTITYVDGTTVNVNLVLAQDVDGNTYLIPKVSDGASQQALEAHPIRSITLNTSEEIPDGKLATNRQTWNIAPCFAAGTLIRTECGERPIEELRPGDLIPTLTNGLQPIRWIGKRRVAAQGGFAPVLFRAGAIGNRRDLRVSPQHRMMLSDWRVELYTGAPEALVAARHLVNGRNIVTDPGGEITYFHMLFDRHEIIRAEGCLSESFYPGRMGLSALQEEARAELLALFPQLASPGPGQYGPTARPVLDRHEALVSLPSLATS